MVAFIFIVGCAVVGFLLYLPFLLLFRRMRRRGAMPQGATSRVTRGGLLLSALTTLAMLGGAIVSQAAPGSWLGMRLREGHGLVVWIVGVVVVSGIVERWLARAGVAFQHPPAPSPTSEGPTASSEGDPPTPSPWFGPWKLATVGGVTLSVDASLPLAGVFVADFLGMDLAVAGASCVAFVALIAAHEAGHLAAARALGLRVFGVHVSGLGGRCRTQVTRGVKDTFLLYSGGILAQVAVLLLALAAVALLGTPASPVARAVVTTLTVVNLVLIAINLVPGQINENLSTDGAVLWDLWLHVHRGRPHPLARQHAASPLLPPGTRLTEIEGMVPEGFETGVQILNDDRTPADFVVAMLETHLRLDRDAAVAAMLRIHTTGGLLVPTGDAAQAEEAASGITRDAWARGYPLRCEATRRGIGATR